MKWAQHDHAVSVPIGSSWDIDDEDHETSISERGMDETDFLIVRDSLLRTFRCCVSRLGCCKYLKKKKKDIFFIKPSQDDVHKATSLYACSPHNLPFGGRKYILSHRKSFRSATESRRKTGKTRNSK